LQQPSSRRLPARDSLPSRSGMPPRRDFLSQFPPFSQAETGPLLKAVSSSPPSSDDLLFFSWAFRAVSLPRGSSFFPICPGISEARFFSKGFRCALYFPDFSFNRAGSGRRAGTLFFLWFPRRYFFNSSCLPFVDPSSSFRKN